MQKRAIVRQPADTPVYLVLRNCIAEKNFPDAVAAAREGGIARSRVVYLAAEIFRKNKDWSAFMELATEDNAECWSFQYLGQRTEQRGRRR